MNLQHLQELDAIIMRHLGGIGYILGLCIDLITSLPYLPDLISVPRVVSS
jgi:hypothetical protein